MSQAQHLLVDYQTELVKKSASALAFSLYCMHSYSGRKVLDLRAVG